MKTKISFLTCLMTVPFGFSASGQGLLGIGADDDFESGLPFKTTIGIDTGWDSNPQARSSDEQDSAYIRGGITTQYSMGNKTTTVDIGGAFSTIYYFDQAEGVDKDTFYNARVTLNARHAVNRQLTIGDNFYLSYEIEPDYVIGASTSRRSDQYLYGYNSLWASYAWSRRVSTISRYTINGIMYDEDDVGDSENRFTHGLSQEVRYALNPTTSLVGEYRYSYTDFEGTRGKSTSNYALAGLDYQFSRDLRGTFRGGAQFRNDDLGDETRPFGEAALRYRLAKYTSFHWINRLGLEESELGSYKDRYTYRSAASVSHQFTERLRGNAGITYVHNDFEGSGSVDDLKEDLISLNLGLSYRVYSNVDLNAGYYFTDVSSDDEFREYDRHRVSLGVSATF